MNEMPHNDKRCMDKMQTRCPRLGGRVFFDYCRTCGELNNPCFKVFDCWWERFDVTDYLRQQLSIEAFERLKASRPRNKVASLVDHIRQARERTCS